MSDFPWTPVTQERAREIDDALGLKMVSIRLPAQLIEDYKLLALKGPYQALMRRVLAEHAQTELARAGREHIAELSKGASHG